METTITLIDFLAIPIVAAGMSFVIDVLKEGFPQVSARAITLAMALIFGTAYYFVSDTAFFVSVLGILGASSTIYGFLLKEKAPDAA